jgi:hypothetical protein
MKYFTSRKSNKLNCPKFGEKGAPNLLTLQIYRFLQNQIASQLSTKHTYGRTSFHFFLSFFIRVHQRG